MKRINPETGTFFKLGDTRPEDGKVFRNYTSRIKQDGYFVESWLSSKSFDKNIETGKQRQREMFTAHKDTRAKRLINSAKNRAFKSDGMVTIDTDWVNVRLMKGRCELTGLPFDLKRNEKFSKNPYAPSIDRIDSENPNYVPENCRLVLWGVNQALNEHGAEVMLPILEALVAKLKQEQCETSSQNSLAA